MDARDHQWWQSACAGGGLTDWAVGTGALASHVKQLQVAGLPYAEPRDGGRLRPDGARLEWKVAGAPPGDGLPFLIEDVTPRSLRVPSGAAAVHANDVQEVQSLIVAVADLDAAAPQYAKLFDAAASDRSQDPLLAADSVTVPCGSARVMLTSSGAGPIHDRLAGLGAGPYALLLGTRFEGTGWLDPDLTGGVPIRLQPVV